MMVEGVGRDDGRETVCLSEGSGEGVECAFMGSHTLSGEDAGADPLSPDWERRP